MIYNLYELIFYTHSSLKYFQKEKSSFIFIKKIFHELIVSNIFFYLVNNL